MARGLVTQSGRTLGEIVTSVKKVSDIVAEIAAASREQSSGIEQVNRAVMQMDELTQQNAALVEQATAASQAMAGQVRELNEMLGRYDTGTESAAAAAPQQSAAPPAAGRQERSARPRRRQGAAGNPPRRRRRMDRGLEVTHATPQPFEALAEAGAARRRDGGADRAARSLLPERRQQRGGAGPQRARGRGLRSPGRRRAGGSRQSPQPPLRRAHRRRLAPRRARAPPRPRSTS